MAMKFSWKSRKLYRIEQLVGRLVYSETLKKYFITRGPIVAPIDDQKFASKCHEIELRINSKTGRPKLFPGEPCTAKLITLPDAVWKSLGDAPALSIVELVRNKNQGGRTQKG